MRRASPHRGVVTDLTVVSRRCLAVSRQELRGANARCVTPGSTTSRDHERHGTGAPRCRGWCRLDEFAALVGDLPQLVDALIDTANESQPRSATSSPRAPVGSRKDALRPNQPAHLAGARPERLARCDRRRHRGAISSRHPGARSAHGAAELVSARRQRTCALAASENRTCTSWTRQPRPQSTNTARPTFPLVMRRRRTSAAGHRDACDHG